MFTGIIESVGTLISIQKSGGDARLQIESGGLNMELARIGDSIATNGVCLTVTSLLPGGFTADASQETLSRTTLEGLQAGCRVNLETALTLSKPLGGHLVSGHVDAVGRVVARRTEGRSERFRIAAPASLARFIAAKGSICLDGVSLTVNQVAASQFTVNIVPHTLEQTVIREYRPGTPVNIEVDLVARYLERLMLGERAAVQTSGSGITLDTLARQGFIRD